MLIWFDEHLFFSENIRAVSRNLSKWQTGETATKNVPKILVLKTHFKEKD